MTGWANASFPMFTCQDGKWLIASIKLAIQLRNENKSPTIMSSPEIGLFYDGCKSKNIYYFYRTLGSCPSLLCSWSQNNIIFETLVTFAKTNWETEVCSESQSVCLNCLQYLFSLPKGDNLSLLIYYSFFERIRCITRIHLWWF